MSWIETFFLLQNLFMKEGFFVGLVLRVATPGDLYEDLIGGFILIKMVLFTGGEGLWHHPAKEYLLKNEVIKVKSREKKIMLSLGRQEKKKRKKPKSRREVPSRRRGRQREGNKREKGKQETAGREGKGPTWPEEILHPHCLPLPAGPGERQPPLCILHRRKLGSLHRIFPRFTGVLCSQTKVQS